MEIPRSRILSRWPGCGAFLLFLACLPVFGESLILPESLWRWRPGTNEASTPIPAWRLPGFVESGFSTAPAPFWYGDVLAGGTQIQGMQNAYGCIFLRKTFLVDNPAEISALRMGALVDDGFVAWINGIEVLRVGMPGEAGTDVTTSTLANNAPEPVAFTSYDLPSPPSYLVAGTNLLAVQVFQSSLGSSDLGFEASLDAVLRETVRPVIVSTVPAPGQTVDNLVQLTVAFSEPVSGVVAAHLLINGIGATAVTAVDDATYTFTFPQPSYGPIPIRWSPNHTIVDHAQPPNRFDALAPGATWEVSLVDRTAPIVAGVSPSPGSTVRSLDTITILFSEPVTGVEAADLLVNDRAAALVTRIAASQYRFDFPSPGPGSVQVTWASSHGIVDVASPPNPLTPGSWTYRLDPDAAEPAPYLSEFMASNTRTLRDDAGEFSDWIEIYNPAAGTLNLEGWYLTDSTNNPTKWRFPSTNLVSGGFLVVFASGRDRRVPGAPLHTSFQLAAEGEYLALVMPDGTRVSSEYAPAFPQQVPDVSHGVAQVQNGDVLETGPAGVYFTTPTPGTANVGGAAIPGPILTAVQHLPNVPRDDQDLVVIARVQPVFQPIATIELHYRIQFGTEGSTPMLDDGAHGDGTAGDGVFGASIPANLSTNGQMIRYYVSASDAGARVSRWPLFTQPAATEEYLGTVVEPSNVSSRLPVFHLFVAPSQMGRIDSESGGRAAFFFDGEFYDNIYVELRGNTSAGLNKKSHRLEFNRGHELRHPGPGGTTRHSSLLAEYLDPAYLRQHLCFWLLGNVGVPAPFNYPVRVQLNGQFYQLAFHSDVIGKEQMERMGYDPRGALYKAVGNLTPDFSSTGVFQKLEPENDPTRTDYLQLANGINEASSLAVRRKTVFDLLDVPQVINHLAGTRWCAENDDVWANMSLYRDTFGDGLWRNVPFDMNASWGQLYGGSSPLEATVDSSKSHPLYGGSSTESNFNRLYDVIVRLPETRQMLLRRERSILDGWIQPPETPPDARILENYIRQMTNRIAIEASLDRAKWGFSPWAPGKTFAAGVGDLFNQFIVPRRRHWYVTHSITNTGRPVGINSANNAGIPLSQPPDVQLHFVDVDFNPASGNQNQEFVAISNASPVAVDLTGWKMEGGVNFTFQPGTVLPTNHVLYVSPDVRQFRARGVGPRGGQGLFVVGPYSGHLSARGESLTLKSDLGRTVDAYDYPGAPSAAQQLLRVTEIMFHPAGTPGNAIDADEFEFLELLNLSKTTALDLTGVRFISGVEFNFTGSLVTNLAPGARVLVVGNAVAFASRYGNNLPIAGEYLGRLDNGGERLRILDAHDEEILDFEFNDWYAAADGQGYSLVVVDENAPPESWNARSQWKPGAVRDGTPGRAEEPGVDPAGEPAIVAQPISQSILPGGPLVFSLGVTNTARLPLGIWMLRGTDTSPLTPATFASVDSHAFFLTLTGSDATPPWTQFAFVVTNQANPTGISSATVHVTYLADADGDSLADAWETQYFQGLAAHPDSDPDGDGENNREEQLAGTDPSDPESHLRIEALELSPTPLLRFLAVSNRTYSVQVTDGLPGRSWTRIADLPASGTNRLVEWIVPADSPRRFYRLVTPRQP